LNNPFQAIDINVPVDLHEAFAGIARPAGTPISTSLGDD
jgi:hypothetical protein